MECLSQGRRFAEQVIRRLIIGAAATGAVWGCQPHPSDQATPPQGNDAPAAPAARSGADSQAQAAIRFVDVSQAAGLTQATWCGRPDKPHLFESGGYGLALFDYDGDGALDLYLVNGWRVEGQTVVERSGDRLYRNRGDGTFDDVTAESGLGQNGWGCGVAVGDIDNDGWLDLYVTTLEDDLLYRNLGNGRFEPVSDGPSVQGWSTGAVFFDADGDRDQDLFVSGYIVCSVEDVLTAQPTLEWKGRNVMFGPFGLEGELDHFFQNQGDGTFIETTAEAGLTDHGRFYGFTATAFDMDDDLDFDLHVANDSNPQYVYRNNGSGHFEEVGLWSGAALDANGLAQAGMGVAVGDYNNDSRPDLVLTTFADDSSTLFQNQGNGLFQDVAEAEGVGQPTFKPLSWGTALADFDQDGDLDLFIVNGHIYPQANEAGTGTSYEQENLLLRNDAGRFHDISSEAGPGLRVKLSGRGLAVGDIDGDGDLDLVISNIDAPPTVLRNETTDAGSWLMVDAPTAVRVELTAGSQRQVRHAVRGGSFVSASDWRFHFGLGKSASVEMLKVYWPDGTVNTLNDVPVNQVIVVRPQREAEVSSGGRAAGVSLLVLGLGIVEQLSPTVSPDNFAMRGTMEDNCSTN